MVNLLQKTVAEGFAHFLVSLTKQFPEYLKQDFFEMPNIFTHDDLSMLIGTSRQSITTITNSWERHGYIKISKQILVITIVKDLQKLLDVALPTHLGFIEN